MIKLILTLTLIKGIAWVLFVPLWHFPDEQAHFGHVAYLAEGGQLPMGRANDLNQEIAIAEQRLGTYRNKYGNNDFTYRPEYRLEYTDNYTGKYEEEIKILPLNLRKEYKDPESAYYPHFFYRVSGLVYKLFYNQDLFVRVFAIRLFWLIAHMLMVYLAYLIGKMIFPKSSFAAVSVAILTSFQPMLSFVAAGVTSDNLHNVLFTAVIYFCLKLGQKLKWQNLLGLMTVMALGYINKPQFLISFGIAIPVIIWRLFKDRQYKLIAILNALGATLFLFITKGRLPYFEMRPNVARPDYGLWQHVVYTVQHTVREVLPWYWGVFRWLSLALPHWVNQIMMRLLVVAGIGLVIKLFKRRLEPGLGIIIWSALVYFLALFFWDFQQVRSAGFPFGIQGRYYFPVIVPHMVLLVIGIRTLWSKLLLPLNLWFIGLNWIGFYTVIVSYYDLSSFKTFIVQASQYKPFFAKGWWLISVLFLYLFLSLIFSIRLLKNEK
jgi:hypothetical protein